MAFELEFQSDVNRSIQKVQGSVGRLNVSSRTDSRGYYNSRDDQRAFSLVYNMDGAATGEYVAYWKNTSTDERDLVISGIGANSVLAARVKIHFVTGTATGGDAAIPCNLNKSSSKEAAASCMIAGANDGGILGLASACTIDFEGVEAAGHAEFLLDDRVRLGQGDAIAVEVDNVASDSDVWGVIFGYYEKVRD